MSFASKLLNLIQKGNNKMGTSYDNLTSVINNLIGGYKEASWIDLGTGTSFNVKNIAQQYGVDYTTLTADNFVISSVKNTHYAGGSAQNYGDWGNAVQTDLSFTKSYNASTGILTCSVGGHSWNYDSNGTRNHCYGTASVQVYLLLAKKGAGTFSKFYTGSVAIEHNATSKTIDVSSYDNITISIYGQCPQSAYMCNCSVSYVNNAGQTIGLGTIQFENNVISNYVFTNIKDVQRIVFSGGYVRNGTLGGSYGIICTGSAR